MNQSATVRASKAHEYIGVCRTAFWKLAKEPGFPAAIDLGARAKAYIRIDLDRWLESRRLVTKTGEAA